MEFDWEFVCLLLLAGGERGCRERSIAGVADRTVCLVGRNAGSPFVFLLAACE